MASITAVFSSLIDFIEEDCLVDSYFSDGLKINDHLFDLRSCSGDFRQCPGAGGFSPCRLATPGECGGLSLGGTHFINTNVASSAPGNVAHASQPDGDFALQCSGVLWQMKWRICGTYPLMLLLSQTAGGVQPLKTFEKVRFVSNSKKLGVPEGLVSFLQRVVFQRKCVFTSDMLRMNLQRVRLSIYNVLVPLGCKALARARARC